MCTRGSFAALHTRFTLREFKLATGSSSCVHICKEEEGNVRLEATDANTETIVPDPVTGTDVQWEWIRSTNTSSLAEQVVTIHCGIYMSTNGCGHMMREIYSYCGGNHLDGREAHGICYESQDPSGIPRVRAVASGIEFCSGVYRAKYVGWRWLRARVQECEGRRPNQHTPAGTHHGGLEPPRVLPHVRKTAATAQSDLQAEAQLLETVASAVSRIPAS